MKRHVILLGVLVVLIAASASAQKVKDGFKGYKWGTNIKEFDSTLIVSLTEEEGDSKVYSTSIKTLGSTQVEVLFVFYKGLFYMVQISTEGYTNSQSLLNSLTKVYGKPKKENEYSEKYRWTSAKSARSYTINTITNEGTFVSVSFEINDIRTKDEEEAAKKAAEEF